EERKRLVAGLVAMMMRRLGDSTVEFGYYGVPPAILIEKLLTEDDGSIPRDYKLFVFHGRVAVVQVDLDRFSEPRRAMMDRTWRRLPFVIKYPAEVADPPRPSNFHELVSVAERLAHGFSFLRIDLY